MPKSLEYFFDVICPYSWIGFKMILREKSCLERSGFNIRFTPLRLSTLLKTNHELLSDCDSFRVQLLLNLIRIERPELMEKAMEITWSLGLEFRQADDLISRIEQHSNRKDLRNASIRALAAGALLTPFTYLTNGENLNYGFSGIVLLQYLNFIINCSELFGNVASSSQQETTEI
ncbi:unnamed protein product [Dracunculus medinensis]|uniref:DSBA domain-containing protein n=1 Tax=Dracunculus medinensis TaxID=318479 RepID=A0A0N4U308_DRAME|nr:unnamed protein product [Dracunculus medinensis]